MSELEVLCYLEAQLRQAARDATLMQREAIHPQTALIESGRAAGLCEAIQYVQMLEESAGEVEWN